MRSLWRDVDFTFRQLRKNPGFTLTAILSLALGIGATTAVFSVVYAVLVNPYPYREPDRLVYLLLRDKAGNDRGLGYSAAQIRQLRQVDALESVIPMNSWSLTTTDGDLPEDVEAVYIGFDGMAQLGVPPLAGRTLLASDAPEGQDPQPVIVLGYKFWQKHYGGRADILGRTLQLVHKTYTIVGIMPPRFTWQGGEVYLPLKLADQNEYWQALRLKPGVSRERADAELQPVLEQFAKEKPERYPQSFRVRVGGLNDWVSHNMGGSLKLLFAAVGLMLLIGCANVSILLLARGATRQHELALRASIGAGRSRIICQLLTESLILAGCGAALGIALARELIVLIMRWLPQDLFPSEASVRLNLPVLAFATLIALLTGVLFGLWPALQLSRPDLAQMVQAGSRRTTGGAAGHRMRAILVGSQVALTLVLLTGAGDAITAFEHMMRMNLGYDPHHTMSIGIPVHDNTHMKWEDRAQYFEQIRARISELPEVVDAGISTNATPPRNGMPATFGQILVRARGEPLALLRAVRQQVHSVDADQQINGNPQNLEQWIATSPEWAGERLVTFLLSGFSVLALALAVFGLYSVVSHSVARRTNEFGIRMALGARQEDVLRLVFTSTAGSVTAGILVGTILSMALEQATTSWTQETARNPLILAAVAALLAGAAAAACVGPARRASTIDPVAALRYE